jgi:hypothetical protein
VSFKVGIADRRDLSMVPNVDGSKGYFAAAWAATLRDTREVTVEGKGGSSKVRRSLSVAASDSVISMLSISAIPVGAVDGVAKSRKLGGSSQNN